MDSHSNHIDGNIDDDNDDSIVEICMGVVAYYDRFLNKQSSHTRPFSGWANLSNMLNCDNGRRCYENLRMKKHVFFMLCKTLVDDYGLKATRSVTIEEQVATFLMIVGTRQGNRQLQEFFQRSGYTICKSFHQVSEACMKMSKDWIRSFTESSIVHPYIKNNSKYYPYFKDCIGAMDGTHIPARLPVSEQIPFIGRKGCTTQNVLAICDFDLYFTYAVVGWEGSAHDTRIFNDALRDPRKEFPVPPKGKYYLVDAGYPNTVGFLAPYKGQKYHLPEFRQSRVYNNQSEVFNHVHSSLRSAIERSFGIWKNKFHILNDMPMSLRFKDQVALVPATMAIHNFIRRKDYEDKDFQQSACDINATCFSNSERNHGPTINCTDETMNLVRNNIRTMINSARIVG